MVSKQRSIGTRFETACVGYLRRTLMDDRIERRALHGNKDMGDIFGLSVHGNKGIVECKSVKRIGRSLLDEFREQTVNERDNADSDFALLVIHKAGVGDKRFGENDCQMQIRDLEKIAGGSFTCLAGDSARDMWVSMTLGDACRIMTDDFGDDGDDDGD